MEQSLEDVLNGVDSGAEAGTVESEVMASETISEAEQTVEDIKGEPEKEESSEAEAEEKDTKPVSENEDKEPWTKTAYLDEKRKRQELERKLQEREKPKAPDIFEDQDQYTGFVEEKINNAVGNTRAEMSEFFARREYGADVVESKFEKFQEMVDANPELRMEVAKSASPWHAMVEKVNAAEKMEKLKDIDKYEAEVRADIEAKVRAELEAEHKKESDKLEGLTPSLAGKRSVGDKDPVGDVSLEDILGR